MTSPFVRRAIRGSAVLSMVGLAATVLLVAAVAVAAEATALWSNYFLMQRVTATATPVAVAFLCLAIISGFGVVAVAAEE